MSDLLDLLSHEARLLGSTGSVTLCVGATETAFGVGVV